MKEKLKQAAEEGLLLFVKYALVLGLLIFSFNYFTRINQAALNGEQAALMLMELQKKGWLPQLTNGQIPERDANEKISNNQPVVTR